MTDIFKNLKSLQSEIKMTKAQKEAVENFLMAKISSEAVENGHISFWLRVANVLVPNNFVLQPAMAFSLVLGLFLIISFASVNASKNTLPGDALYPVKLTAENIKYNLTFSDAEKAKAAMSRVEARMTELKIIVGQEDGEKQAKVAQSASQMKEGLNRVKGKIQDLKQNSESSEVVAVAKEIDEKLVVLKNEINKTSQESTGDSETALKEVAQEVEKTSEVVVAALETENIRLRQGYGGQAPNTENTTTPVVEGEATTTILSPEQDFNTTSELIIEKDAAPVKPVEFKVGISE